MEREPMFAQEDTWRIERLGRFTASEMHRLMKGGKRPMTDEELANRQKGEKRTTIDTLFGDGATTYINEVIAEILTGEAAEQRDFKATEWGQANELDAVLEFQEKTGLEIDYYGISNPKFFPFGDMAGGSPDGLVAEDAIAEVKCPYNTSYHVEYLRAGRDVTINIQDWFKETHFDYYVQTQKNMLVTGRDKCYFISYDPRMVDTKHKLFVMIITLDEQLIEEMKIRLDKACEIVKNALSKLK